MERADLTPSVVEELVGADRAADHLIHIFAGLAVTVDFLVLAVGELAGHDACAGGDHAELVDGRNTLGARRGKPLGGWDFGYRRGDRLAKHLPSPWIRDGVGLS